MNCFKNKCERCKKYSDKCHEYRNKYLKQETKNDELMEMIDSLVETQLKIVEYIESKKVSGVNIKKITTKEK